MFGRLPRTRERLKTSAYLQKLEKVEDVLSEQRALAVNRKPVQECLPSGSLVYVRLHDPDRRFKVGKKWTTMTVLRQDGNKVYLSMSGSNIGGHPRIIERHIRECLPVPPRLQVAAKSSTITPTSSKDSRIQMVQSGPLRFGIRMQRKAQLQGTASHSGSSTATASMPPVSPSPSSVTSPNLTPTMTGDAVDEINETTSTTRSGRRTRRPVKYSTYGSFSSY
ncbi:hypothetical protein FOZ60_016964 [Perkinsus olseni]|nr:hypothetical protein FOZ60_016964 [Perkinsus olseni]